MTTREQELEAEVARLTKDLDLTRGAMRAQDEREEAAGKRCGVLYELHTCDWPDGVADEVLFLQAEVARLRRIEAAAERLYDRWCNLEGEMPEAEYFNALDEARKETN